jgi:hypothetical protein
VLLGNVVAGYRFFFFFFFLHRRTRGTVLVYSVMKLNACSLLALFDWQISEEIPEKIFWR